VGAEVILLTCAVFEIVGWVPDVEGVYVNDTGEVWAFDHLGGLEIRHDDGTVFRYGYGVLQSPRYGLMLVLMTTHADQLACYGLFLTVAVAPGGSKLVSAAGIWLREKVRTDGA
jgi:hypothetical protein